MPGIAGIISQKPIEGAKRLVKTMASSMEHEPFYVSGTCCFPEMGVYAGWVAHQNSFASSQPFWNEQGDIALVFAGECPLTPHTEVELLDKGPQLDGGKVNWLVRLYEEEGDNFFEKLNGLFSGLLIDKRRRKAFLFNDRYGVERIYWHESEDGFYFASEAKALLRVLPALRAFDEEGVAQFLSYGCTLDERTLFRGIQLLPGASLWSFDRDGCRKGKYFSPAGWETQSILSAEDFTVSFQETFKRILPPYLDSETRIGISLTGGLDTRMIMACRPDSGERPLCYTFSGPDGQTMDDRIAHRVARLCGLDHQLLRIGPDFFADFAHLVDQTVFVTDGCFGATGAHEIYFNRRARQFSPVRLTGNYGSEVLRGVSTFKPLRLASDLTDRSFISEFPTRYIEKDKQDPVTFAAFYEIPHGLFGSLAAGRSQVRFRTPYLDNELVALAYRAPRNLRRSRLPSWNLISKNNPALARVPTDRGRSQTEVGAGASLRHFFYDLTFKLDYLNNEGWPSSLSPFEPIFTQVSSAFGILGLHKYLHYRSWFRRELSDYLKSRLANAQSLSQRFGNRRFLERMANDHIAGRKNYVLEINAVLTLEAVERLLFRELPHEVAETPTASVRSAECLAESGA